MRGARTPSEGEPNAFGWVPKTPGSGWLAAPSLPAVTTGYIPYMHRILSLADQIHATVYDPTPDWLDLADAADELARLMRKQAAEKISDP